MRYYNNEIHEIHVWYDYHNDSRPWTVSLCSSDGEEISCVSSYKTLEDAEACGEDEADSHYAMMVIKCQHTGQSKQYYNPKTQKYSRSEPSNDDLPDPDDRKSD
jgi:hypothetical protein